MMSNRTRLQNTFRFYLKASNNFVEAYPSSQRAPIVRYAASISLRKPSMAGCGNTTCQRTSIVIDHQVSDVNILCFSVWDKSTKDETFFAEICILNLNFETIIHLI